MTKPKRKSTKESKPNFVLPLNAGPFASETDQLESWPSKITGHFRFPKF